MKKSSTTFQKYSATRSWSFFVRSVIFTSLPAFILAEIFFAWLYFIVVQIIRAVYTFLATIGSTAQIEANMQIFSPLNIGIFLIGLAIISVIMCLEIMTIIAITTYDYYRNDHIPLKTLIRFSFDRLRKLLRPKSAPFFIFIFFFPKLHIGPSGLFALDIPPFIYEEIIKFPAYLLFVIAFLGIGAYIVYRSLFVLHYLFFERSTIRRAFRSSFLLTKKIGHKKMIAILAKNIAIIMLFMLPIVAIGMAFARYIDTIEWYIGSKIFIVSDMLKYLTTFLSIGLTGALFLAGITVAYIRYAGFRQLHFEQRFSFLADRPEFTPRWQNIRLMFQKKYPLLILGILLACSPLFLAVILRFDSHRTVVVPEIISHRGAARMSDGSPLIENTISAILEAKEQWATKIEIDIYENKDGTLILSHDDNLSRVAKINKKIADMTDREIEQIRLPNGEKIPTLDEVLSVANMRDIHLIIEPKIHGGERHIYEELVRLLLLHDMVGRVEIHSLNMSSLEAIRKLNPHIPVGYIVFGGYGNIAPVGVDFISLQETIATRWLIASLHKNDKKVYVWTVNNVRNVEKYMQMGADGIITDNIVWIQHRVQSVLATDGKTPYTIFRILNYDINLDDWNNFWYRIFWGDKSSM